MVVSGFKCVSDEDDCVTYFTYEDEFGVTVSDSVSYSFGLEYAFGLKNQGLDTIIDVDLFCKAFRDIFQNDSLDISKEDGGKILDEYFIKKKQDIIDKQLSENRKLIEESNGDEIISFSADSIEQ